MVLASTVGLLSGAAVGAYIIAVGLNSQALPLWEELKTETGYLYFLGSLFAIGALHKYGPTGRITDALLLLSIAGVAVKVGANLDYEDIRKYLFPEPKLTLDEIRISGTKGLGV